ncbi:MAG: sugar transferase, partial [bacterium]
SLDIFWSFVLLLLTFPIFFILFILLKLQPERKVFFIQNRTGLNGKTFKLIKFTNMNDEKDTEGNLLPDEMRITTLGRYLRATSLDELPQLINVLKGDMSLIGPRPLLPKYIPLYSKDQYRRHEVRPGITGWAQVNGRNNISWTKKFELDVWYVENVSFWLDLKIIYLTIVKVLKREDVSKDGFATTEPFNGYN